jgi:hypothetical protein
MDTTVSEIADHIYRFSTLVPDVGPTGFTFNQYLIDDEQPLLFHTGHRAAFPLLSEAIATITPVDRLRWITFGHVEADECGAMNELLAAAPRAEVAHGVLGCAVSLNDLADRPPVALADDQLIELGQHRVRHIDTPHVPHGWEARVLYEETTKDAALRGPFRPARPRPGPDKRRHHRGSWPGRRRLRCHLPHPEHRPDHPAAGRPLADHAGSHARLLLRGRRGRKPSRVSRTTTTSGCRPRRADADSLPLRPDTCTDASRRPRTFSNTSARANTGTVTAGIIA